MLEAEGRAMPSDLCAAAPPHIECKDRSALFLIQDEKGIDKLWPQEGRDSIERSEGNLEGKILIPDVLDLPHLNAPIKLHLLLRTLEDLHKKYETSKPHIQVSNDGRESPLEELQKLYRVLKFAKDLWAKQACDWGKVTAEDEGDLQRSQFEEIGEVVTERLYCTDIKHNEAFAKNQNGESEPNHHCTDLLHDFGTLMSPNSVLSGSRELNSNFKGSQNITYLPPLLQPVQLQAMGRLKPRNRKKLSLNLFPLVLDHNLDTPSQIEKEAGDLELDALATCMISEPISYVEIQNGHGDGRQPSEDIESPYSSPGSTPRLSTSGTCQPTSTKHLPPATDTNRNEDSGSMASKFSVIDSPNLPRLRLSMQILPPTPAPPPPSPMVVTAIPTFPPPTSPMVLTGTPMSFESPRFSTLEVGPFGFSMDVSEPSKTPLSVSLLSPSMLNAQKTEISVSLPIDMPPNEEHKPNTEASTKQLSLSPSLLSKFASPPPPPSSSKNSTLPESMPLSPCPSSVGGSSTKGSGPPPPPPLLGGAGKSLCFRKTISKLKRSTQMRNLYRVLKGKVEGSNLDIKPSNGRKNQTGHSSGGDKAQGMADALAEMTKRSSYFRQIEEDVENHSASISELRSSLNALATMDMKELLKFHRDMERLLEKLTDETQVLARFEGFPTKKLETVRMAVALYKKLESIVATLKGWKLESPIRHKLDKVESYFTKMKEEVDVIERGKEEEIKRFKAHKIEFDFTVITKIKEAMVDLSSDCIEFVLKETQETRETDAKSPTKSTELSKMLWRAFQMAFRVYNFAGGQDDRADRLTKELAHEIEATYPPF